MPLRVLAGPGCDAVGKDEYLEDELEDGDVVISVGRIFKALTGSSGVPSENPPALRLALGLRSVAIRSAREKQLSGFILTSRTDPTRGPRSAWSPRRARSGVTIIKLTEAQACDRVSRQLVPKVRRGARRAWTGVQARAGLHAISRKPTDREVDP